MIDVQQILKAIEAHVRGWIQEMGGTPGSGGYAPKPHDLSSDNHTGSISDAQGPQFLKTDGSRMLTGNQAVAAGATIDGVDVSELGSGFAAHAAATAAGGHAGGVGNHTHQSAGAQGGPLDHGAALTGLGDDDHAQYLNNARHDTPTRHTLGTVVPHDNHANLTGLTTDGHPQYLRTDGTRAVAGNLVPDATDARDLGAIDRLWRKGWLSELDSVVFAQQTQTLVGNYLVVGKGEGTLGADTSAGAVSVDFGQAMTVGDFVLLRSAGQVEYLRVGALVSGTTYSVTRDLDGSGANAWPKGSVYLILGQDGAGRIVLNAVDTPRIQILRQGNGYNLDTEVARLGDMNGVFGFMAEEYGIGIGDYAAGNYIRYGTLKGFKLQGGNGAVSIDETGIDIAAYNGEFPADPNSIDFVGVDGVIHTRMYGTFDDSYNIVRTMLTSENALGSNGTDITLLANGDKNLSSGTGSQAQALLKAQTKISSEANRNYAHVKAFASVSLPSDPYVELYVYSVNGARKVTLNRRGLQVDDGAYLPMPDGWAPAGETWTYASATTFTVAGDVRTKYPVGTKIKLTQSSTKYFYVVATSYASPNTTVTITGGSDYSLANATITDNWLSYARTPQGFPDVFNWTPTFTGYSANPTGGVYRFRVDGRQVTVVVREPNLGTSNAASLTISAPVVARTLTGATWLVPVSLADNGVTLTTWGRGRIGSGESVFTFGTNPAIDGGFTVTGGKRVSAFQITYEI